MQNAFPLIQIQISLKCSLIQVNKVSYTVDNLTLQSLPHTYAKRHYNYPSKKNICIHLLSTTHFLPSNAAAARVCAVNLVPGATADYFLIPTSERAQVKLKLSMLLHRECHSFHATTYLVAVRLNYKVLGEAHDLLFRNLKGERKTANLFLHALQRMCTRGIDRLCLYLGHRHLTLCRHALPFLCIRRFSPFPSFLFQCTHYIQYLPYNIKIIMYLCTYFIRFSSFMVYTHFLCALFSSLLILHISEPQHLSPYLHIYWFSSLLSLLQPLTVTSEKF